MNTDTLLENFIERFHRERRAPRRGIPHPCASAFLGLLLASCAVGPNYSKPDVATPPAYKEAGNWVVARPSDEAPKGKWWEIFRDPVLDGLAEQVSVSNQTLIAAQARYAQARASTQAAKAAYFPTVGVSADASRAKRAGGQAATSYSVSLDARWEADLWGRIRRQVEASAAAQEASAADVEAARLSLQAELAIDYFLLRANDAQSDLLDDSVKAFRTSFTIAQNRYRAGVAGKVDVVQAESQLRSIEAQAIDLHATRAQLEHAIAVLIGKPASEFAIEKIKFEAHVPDIPPGVPSTLLQRRPDIAAAERRMAAANARIGVAEAAYFPSLSLTASGGSAAGTLASLFSAPTRAWSLGLGLADTILDFGARSAQVESSRAAYDEAVANYRGTVLDAFRDVEDNLASIHYLADELEVQRDAARLARESVTLTLNQYKAGTVGFLNVVLVQASQLSQERDTVNLVGRRLVASVALVRALGGGW